MAMLVLTMGEKTNTASVRIDTPSGVPIIVRAMETEPGRFQLAIEAPAEFKIDRLNEAGEPVRGHATRRAARVSVDTPRGTTIQVDPCLARVMRCIGTGTVKFVDDLAAWMDMVGIARAMVRQGQAVALASA